MTPISNQSLATELEQLECRQSTDLNSPLFVSASSGCQVTDVDGQTYWDLTSGFSVANLGHNPDWLIKAWRDQLGVLVHAMGDVGPSPLKIQVLKKLTSMFQYDQGHLGVTGSDAVEFALKTAWLGKPNGKHFIVFSGSYHGLNRWPLSVTSLSPFSEGPMKVTFPRVEVPFPVDQSTFDQCQSQFRSLWQDAIAVISEPIQGRAGERMPVPDFLPWLNEQCQQNQVDLIMDEIYTGFYRSGQLRASHQIRPTMICLGKALGNGLPVSAVLADKAVMNRWPKNWGEALHTGTFVGNPLALAGASEVLDFYLSHKSHVLNQVEMIQAVGNQELSSRSMSFRIQGALGAIETQAPVVDTLRAHKILALPTSTGATGIGLCPPLVITEEQWRLVLKTICNVI